MKLNIKLNMKLTVKFTIKLTKATINLLNLKIKAIYKITN